MQYQALKALRNWASEAAATRDINPEFRIALTDLVAAIDRILPFF